MSEKNEKALFVLTLQPEPGMTVERAIWKAAPIAYYLGCIVAFSIGEISIRIHPLDDPEQLCHALSEEERNRTN